MVHRIDSDSIYAMTKKTLGMMTQKKIPFYWEYYLVWLAYFLGVHKDLEADIDRIKKEGGQFTEEVHRDLYAKHFGKDTGRKSVQDAQSGIQQILHHVLDEILHTQHFTSGYRDKLEGFTKQLKKAGDLDDIHKVVAHLMLDTVAVIQASDRLKENLAESIRKSEKLQRDLEEAQREILIDPLTLLNNRKAFDKQISTCLKGFQEKGTDFTLLMMDIDSFKQFNDQYGHQLGDKILKLLGALLSNELKGKDFVARYGGEEFVILLNGTSLEKACLVAENIRKSLDGLQLKSVKTGQSLGKITISAGVSTVRKSDTVEFLVKRADDALYLAKQSGRNNIKSELDLSEQNERSEIAAPSLTVEFLRA